MTVQTAEKVSCPDCGKPLFSRLGHVAVIWGQYDHFTVVGGTISVKCRRCNHQTLYSLDEA